jgi:hypothetical protein
VRGGHRRESSLGIRRRAKEGFPSVLGGHFRGTTGIVSASLLNTLWNVSLHTSFATCRRKHRRSGVAVTSPGIASDTLGDATGVGIAR